jgi:hypothetical protein
MIAGRKIMKIASSSTASVTNYKELIATVSDWLKELEWLGERELPNGSVALIIRSEEADPPERPYVSVYSTAQGHRPGKEEINENSKF